MKSPKLFSSLVCFLPLLLLALTSSAQAGDEKKDPSPPSSESVLNRLVVHPIINTTVDNTNTVANRLTIPLNNTGMTYEQQMRTIRDTVGNYNDRVRVAAEEAAAAQTPPRNDTPTGLLPHIPDSFNQESFNRRLTEMSERSNALTDLTQETFRRIPPRR